MKAWTSWLARVGVAGSCLMWVGCGGGESTDGEAVPEAVAGGEPVVEGDPTGGQMAGQAATQGGAAGGAERAAPEPESAQPSEPGVAGVGKADSSSGTAELLALASAPAPQVGAPAEGQGGAAGGQALPGSEGGASGEPATMSPGNLSAPPGITLPGQGAAQGGQAAVAGYPGAPGGSGPPPGYPGAPPPGIAPPGSEGFPGGGGGIGFPGGAGGPGDNTPANFDDPYSAVKSFLAALSAKDPDRLAEATALRAPTEASPELQKVFRSITELSLSPDELNTLAKLFDGMQIQGQNVAKSTARLSIIVGKTDESGDQITRTITVRKEKAGWKVVDVSRPRVIDNPSRARRPGGGR